MRSLLGRFHRPMSRGAMGDMLTMNNLGDGSTLSLDFTAMGGVLDPRLTFTCASTVATYINSSGYVATATTNEPRFDYSPTTIGEPRGLLIEGQASTINAWSEDFTQSYWNKVNTTIASTSVTCPDNIARTTVRVTDNNTNNSHSIRRGIATTAGSTYTLSWFVKKGSTDTFGVQVYWDGTYNTTLLVSSIDNNTQTVTSATNVNATVSRISYPSSGWFRYVMTFTHPSATGAATPDFNFAPINSFNAYIGSSNYTDFFGIQLELGSGASSYIPTGASQVTRNADFLLSASSSGAGRTSEFSFDDLAPGTSVLNEYTVLWTYGRDPNSKQEYPASLYARTNSNTERIDLRDFTGTTVEAGTETRTVQARNIGTALIAKVALAQSTSTYPSSAVNGTSATLTSGAIDSALGLQWVQLGNSSAVSGSFNSIWARQLKLYPTQLTAAQLQTLTTP